MDKSTPVRLAIVGSTRFAADPASTDLAVAFIEPWLERFNPEVVVSGGASGIDQLGAALARHAHIEVREHLPENPQWAPKGYKERNELIARDCTHLMMIRHSLSSTFGSGWTANRAEELGKWVERYEIGVCTICADAAWYVHCPTGGWWQHHHHPENDHDAEVKESALSTGLRRQEALTLNPEP